MLTRKEAWEKTVDQCRDYFIGLAHKSGIFSSHIPLAKFWSHSSIQLQGIQGSIVYLCAHDERENMDFV